MGVSTATPPTRSPLRVGIVGASPKRGWAAAAHLPALAALPGLTCAAVSSTRLEGAREVAQRWGVPHAFGSAAELITCDDVEAVAITVKAPDHGVLVRASIEAGKHVFCEWPLGVDSVEGDALAALAVESGVVHLVGLQAYHGPGAVFVRQLIDRGTIGELMGVSMAVLTPGMYGAHTTSAMNYTLDPINGVTLITVPTAHALAGLSRAVGDLAEVDASLTVRHQKVTLTDTGEQVANSTPNEVAVVGRLHNGALATLSVHGGTPPGVPRLSMRVIGTAGALLIGIDEAGASVNVGDWTVALAKPDGTTEAQSVPPHPALPSSVSGPAKNVAIMYHEFARAVVDGVPVEPDFTMAARFHRVVESIATAAETGIRQQVPRYAQV